ncbi:alpha/beta hydrolase [Furfurilactobacillus sp. WILCCON 0119]
MRKAIGALVTVVLVFIIGFISWHTNAASKPNNANYHYSQTPTLFLHGYGGGSSSTKDMINAAQSSGAATKVLTATVSHSGNVSLSGHWQRGKVNPMVQVIFKDNKNGHFFQNATWLKRVVTALQRRYHITQFNVVAHSMGNLDLMYYEARFGQKRTLPQLNKYVALAGHFDGILGMDDKANQNHLLSNGQPTRMNDSYRYLLKHQANFPKNQISVLNVYGNLNDGTASDGRVSNVSSKSLAYLLGTTPRHYTAKMITGKGAQHSRLHNNAAVNKLIIDFLWGK